MAHTYYPAVGGPATVMTTAGLVDSSGLSSSGKTADQLKVLDDLVKAGKLRTDKVQGAPYPLRGQLAALGTAELNQLTCGVAGKIVEVNGVCDGNGDTADAVVTVKNVTQDLTIATLTFPTAYVAGTRINGVLTAASLTVADDDVISYETDGGGDGTGRVDIEIIVDVTAGNN